MFLYLLQTNQVWFFFITLIFSQNNHLTHPLPFPKQRYGYNGISYFTLPCNRNNSSQFIWNLPIQPNKNEQNLLHPCHCSLLLQFGNGNQWNFTRFRQIYGQPSIGKCWLLFDIIWHLFDNHNYNDDSSLDQLRKEKFDHKSVDPQFPLSGLYFVGSDSCIWFSLLDLVLSFHCKFNNHPSSSQSKPQFKILSSL